MKDVKFSYTKRKTDCDYYDWLAGKIYVINQYRREYMAQYGWTEYANAQMQKENQ